MCMDELVALKAETSVGVPTYFMTHGRVQSAVDPAPLEALVLRHSGGFKTPGSVLQVSLCLSLAEAISAPLFFEGMYYFCTRPVPRTREQYLEWKVQMAKTMDDGGEIYALGPF